MTQKDCTQAVDAAAELFQTAALLLGSEAEAVAAVEETLAQVQVDPCVDPLAARRDARQQLIDRCIARAQVLSRGALVAPADETAHGPATCIETDDLSAAGIRSEDLTGWVAGAGRERMRLWLEGLDPAPRIIFVLRALLGQNSDMSAEHLRAAGVGSWTADQVSGAFREALCSLSRSLVHAASPVPA